MGRTPCGQNVGLTKGSWTPEEDHKLSAYIQQYGHGSWRALPAKAVFPNTPAISKMCSKYHPNVEKAKCKESIDINDFKVDDVIGLQRCGKSCRLRWTNYLRPDIKRGRFSLQEEQTIIQLHALLGNRWSVIAAHLPKRTDNEIKNHWNTHLKKRLTKMGIDPMTHKPKTHALGSDQLKDATNLSHMAQWEGARLEAEARLVRKSKLQVLKPFQTQPRSSASAHEATTTAPLLDLPLQPLCLEVLTAWQGSRLEAPGYNEFSSGNFATVSSLDSLTTPSNISKKGEAMGLANNFPDEIEILQLQGLAYSTDGDSFAMGNETLLLPNIMEAGLGDVLLDDSNQLYTSVTNGNCGSIAGSCYDNFEANKNYWYNILNVVNCSPSDYPVF